MTEDSMNKGTRTRAPDNKRSRARVDCPADLPRSELTSTGWCQIPLRIIESNLNVIEGRTGK